MARKRAGARTGTLDRHRRGTDVIGPIKRLKTGHLTARYPMDRATAKSWLKVYGRCANVVVTDYQASDLKIAAACAQARNMLI